MSNNNHMRSIQGRLADAEAEIAMLQDTVAHLTGVIEAKDAVIADYERQLARVRHQAAAIIEAARPRIANGNGTA